MITSLARYATVAAVAASAGLAIAARTPAWAGGLSTAHSPTAHRSTTYSSTAFTCDVPMLGGRTVVLDGWLAAPDQAAAGTPAGFRLHISSLRLHAPVAASGWSAAARIDVGGAQDTSFDVMGSGGYVPPGRSISGDLVGGWTPAVPGSHVLSVGGLTVRLATVPAGDVTARCVANEPRPQAGSLLVLPAYDPGWTGPVAPPIVEPPYGPGWHRPIVLPPYHDGWHHGGWGHGGWGHGGWDHHPVPPHHGHH